MRCFLVLVLWTAIAGANPSLPSIPSRPPNAAALRKSQGLVKSGLAHVESWRQGPQDNAKIERAITDLRAAIAAEPANLDAWFRLGDVYGEFGELDGATEVVNGLAAKACDACIGYLAVVLGMDMGCLPGHDPTTWAFATPDVEKLRALIRGKRTTLAAHAEAIATFDLAKIKPLLGASRVVSVTENGRKKALAGAKKVAAWFERMSDFQLEAHGVLTCDEKCCRWVCGGSEGDISHYLDKVCFAKGPELATMVWHSGP